MRTWSKDASPRGNAGSCEEDNGKGKLATLRGSGPGRCSDDSVSVAARCAMRATGWRAASWMRSACLLDTSRIRLVPGRWIAWAGREESVDESGTEGGAQSRIRSSERSQRSRSKAISSRSWQFRGPGQDSVARFRRVAGDALVMRRTRAWMSPQFGPEGLLMGGGDRGVSMMLGRWVDWMPGDFGGGLSPSSTELRLWAKEAIVVRGELSG